ncbi:MAG: flagellar biosynthesis protein FlhB [Treponema sp.]|jgi:flagellar biosynthetic protein FlhB|nr:flagellar biosynthesis protein FlhB [Treponema sp.]
MSTAEKLVLMDLQWFAAEDEGRTEEPTEYKIRKAREEGRVAKSQELIAALGLLFPAVTILFLGRYILRTCVEMVRFFFLRINELDPARDGIAAGVFFRYFARLALPIAAAALVAAVFSNMVQVGLLFTVKPITPDFSRIVPRFGRYFQKTLFSMEGLFNFVKSIVKMAIIGVTAFVLIYSHKEELANLQTAGIWLGFTTVSGLAARLLIISALLLLVLSIPDMLFQRWQFRESLRMTRQEVKEERKMYEGDPQVRARIQRRMREFMSRNMAVNVAKADVVITNPTHFAVALEYDEHTMAAPVLTAKGADEMAFKIRGIARDNGVPVVENKPLARALYADLEVGQLVPEAYYRAIAEILGRIRLLDEQRRLAEGMRA